MENQVRESLANKYRPSDFEQVTAQKAVISILKNQIKDGTFPHFVIFAGPAGTGKTTLARIFAKKINNQEHPDIIEIDGASRNRVDDMKAVTDDARKKSLISPYKIYIIDEVHRVTTDGQNVLLKTLEDCPPYTIFLMATTDPQKILPTVVSRAQVYRITKIPINDIIARLKYICDNEGFTYEEPALSYIARLSKGGMRDAISRLDMCSSLDHNITLKNVVSVLGLSDDNVDSDLLYSIYDALYTDNEANREASEKCIINILEQIYNSGKDIKLFLEQFYQFILDIIKYKLFNSPLNTNLLLTAQLQKDIASYELSKLKKIMEKILTLMQNIKNNTEPLQMIEGYLLLK